MAVFWDEEESLCRFLFLMPLGGWFLFFSGVISDRARLLDGCGGIWALFLLSLFCPYPNSSIQLIWIRVCVSAL